jgi:two-component system sensor histidine kinase BaeS
MRLGITTKLFLALLLTSLVVTIVMGVAVRLSFQQGFHAYLAEQEQQRAVALSTLLVEVYQEHGSWQFLRDNPRQWRHLLRFASRQAQAELDDERPPPGPLVGLSARLSLLDRHKEPVIGPAPAEAASRLYPIVSAGDTVGWLAVAPFQRPVNRADLHFQEQQLKAGLITGGLALLLAAAVSVLLTWRLLVPVRQLAAATHALAAGDYGTRVPVGSTDALGRLAQDFNQLASTLERNEQLRRDFMADISHELRTPLAVLRGELEALQDGVREPTPESLKSLQGEVLALSELVDDLYELALADVGALTYQKSTVDLREVAASAAAGFEARLAERRLQLQCALPEQPLLLSGDRLRLAQLFNNLLENSLRYTDSGGRLQLELRCEGRQAVLSLQDSAPSVPAELLPKLFERFYRLEASRNRGHGGAGLGLALCRSIVEAHGGQIEAQPSPLGGLRILVRLPLGQS